MKKSIILKGVYFPERGNDIAMDEFNNNNNDNGSFGEEDFSGNTNGSSTPQDPYNMPLGSQEQASNPYNQPQNPYGQQQNPYNQQQNPYNMPQGSYNPDGSGSYNPPPQQYGQYQQGGQYQQSGQYQQDYDPYKQPYAGQYQNFGGYNVPMGEMYKTGMATASMVLGIISLLSALSFMNYVFPPLFILPIVGIILGAMYKSKHYPVGKGSSTAGIVCSVIALVISIAILVVAVVLVMTKMPEMLQLIKDYYPEMYEEYYNQFHDQYPQWFEGITSVFRFLIK